MFVFEQTGAYLGMGDLHPTVFSSEGFPAEFSLGYQCRVT